MKPVAPQYLPLFPYLEARKNACLLAPGELVIDNFAGIGGASTGMEAALGRPVDHAINHDPVAVSLHRVNHPHSHHSVEDVWQVDPLDITGGQRVALAWFSPDCRHFSKAKGAALLNRGIRGLAWVAVRWAALVKPRVIILENVEEIQGWGRLTRDGKPDPRYKGETFRSFVNALRRQGYQVEWRELRACDYGTPTIRKRLFLVARRDGLPIIWPEPTHADPKDPRVKAGLLKPFRTAAECLDWTLPCPTIFGRKKPLVPATLNRIAQGLRRFVLEAEKPFIVTCNHGGEGFRGQQVDEPFKTVTAARDAHGLVTPVLAPTVLNKQHQAPARSAESPLSTVTTNHNKNELVVAHLTKFRKDSPGQRPTDPLHTISAEGEHFGVVTSYLLQFQGTKRADEVRGQDGSKPLNVQPTENRFAVVSGCLIKTDNQRSWSSCTYPLTGTTPTTVTRNNQAVVVAHLMQDVSGRTQAQDAVYSPERPARVIVAQGCRQNVVAAHLTSYYGQNGRGDCGQAVSDPLRTIPTKDRFGPMITTCTTVLTEGELARAREVHDFLAAYLTPEQLAPYSRSGLIVLSIDKVEYILADIGLRMLTPRELARCQGFPEDYQLERTAEGKPISKAGQVRGIGNSVCPQLAQVLTHAQLTAVAEEAAD